MRICNHGRRALRNRLQPRAHRSKGTLAPPAVGRLNLECRNRRGGFSSGGIHRNDALDQRRPLLRRNARKDRPISVGHQHCGTDVIQQHGPARAPHILRHRIVGHGLTQRRDHLSNPGIADRRNPRIASSRFKRWSLSSEHSMNKGLIRIAALTRPVEHINLVALLQKQRHPAPAPVRSADPIRPLTVPAMNQDNRMRMSDRRWNPTLHIHLHPIADRPPSQSDFLDAVPVIRPFGDIENRFGALEPRAGPAAIAAAASPPIPAE